MKPLDYLLIKQANRRRDAIRAGELGAKSLSRLAGQEIKQIPQAVPKM